MFAMDRDVLGRLAMRMSSFALVTALAASAMGCSGITIMRPNPPPAPRQVEPTAPTIPTDPPPTGQARVVLDAEGEQAKVSRVVAVMNYDGPRKGRLDAPTPLAPMRAEEPLCITPCAVDLRHGAHTFVFASTDNPMRSSTTDVVLPSNASTTFVRHAIGSEGHMNPSYVGGAALLLLGTGLAAMGAIVTAVGGLGKPTAQDDGTMSNPGALLLPGTIVLGSGLLMAAGGVVMMSKNRPVQQRGSSTTWTKGSGE
jgi:hypothetical protein